MSPAVVAIAPSGPPSQTSTWPCAQIERSPSGTDPGMMASADVLSEHVPPVDVDGDDAQVIGAAKGVSTTVPATSPAPRSVIRSVNSTRSSPV